MTDKTKKIIAREGLVIVGIIVLGLLIIFISSYLKGLVNSACSATSDFNAGCWRVMNFGTWGECVGAVIIFLGYPLYLIVRFIIWAMKTLKRGEIK